MILNLDEKLFAELYPMMLEYNYIFTEEFQSDKQFIEEYLSSKLWRLNNLYTIVDKYGEAIPFKMNYAQHRVYSMSLKHWRLIILKSRQQGISTFWLVSFFDDAIFEENFNVGLMAQGKDEAATLLEKVKLAWDKLDPVIANFLLLKNDKDNSSAFSFSNNSNIFIRTSFRSTTLQRLHISEFGKIANENPKRAKETFTGTLQALAKGNTGIIESTAEGENKFKDTWDKAIARYEPDNIEGHYNLGDKDFLPVFLSWIDDPDCVTNVPEHISSRDEQYFARLGDLTDQQKWFWVMQHRELGEEVYQEYPATPEEAFSAVRSGAYYLKLYDASRVVVDLYDRNIDVDVVLDLGMNDEFVIGFWQYYDGQDRLIGEYTNSGEGLEFYVNYVNDWMKERDADIGVFTCPHDIKVKELGTGITRYGRLIELGVRRIQVLKKSSINTGIEAVRKMMAHLWIDESCDYCQKCLQKYSKEWDPIRENWRDKPCHDKWSHGADMIRYRAMSKRRYTRKNVAPVRQTKGPVVDGLCI